MNRFSLSIFLNALVITFVTLHLLIAFGDETLHFFSTTTFIRNTIIQKSKDLPPLKQTRRLRTDHAPLRSHPEISPHTLKTLEYRCFGNPIQPHRLPFLSQTSYLISFL